MPNSDIIKSSSEYREIEPQFEDIIQSGYGMSDAVPLKQEYKTAIGLLEFLLFSKYPLQDTLKSTQARTEDILKNNKFIGVTQKSVELPLSNDDDYKHIVTALSKLKKPNKTTLNARYYPRRILEGLVSKVSEQIKPELNKIIELLPRYQDARYYEQGIIK
ncbi:hypothetical protein KBD33_05240 [Candidatus Gracilibacteria bacterium]|nr:hypothetical protein [Candidatus Gracilibacteria bacterium]